MGGEGGKTNVRHSVAAFVLSLDRSEQILQLATLLAWGGQEADRDVK